MSGLQQAGPAPARRSPEADARHRDAELRRRDERVGTETARRTPARRGGPRRSTDRPAVCGPSRSRIPPRRKNPLARTSASTAASRQVLAERGSMPRTLAARGETPAAFDWRCIPSAALLLVAFPDMLARRACQPAHHQSRCDAGISPRAATLLLLKKCASRVVDDRMGSPDRRSRQDAHADAGGRSRHFASASMSFVDPASGSDLDLGAASERAGGANGDSPWTEVERQRRGDGVAEPVLNRDSEHDHAGAAAVEVVREQVGASEGQDVLHRAVLVHIAGNAERASSRTSSALAIVPLKISTGSRPSSRFGSIGPGRRPGCAAAAGRRRSDRYLLEIGADPRSSSAAL